MVYRFNSPIYSENDLLSRAIEGFLCQCSVVCIQNVLVQCCVHSVYINYRMYELHGFWYVMCQKTPSAAICNLETQINNKCNLIVIPWWWSLLCPPFATATTPTFPCFSDRIALHKDLHSLLCVYLCKRFGFLDNTRRKLILPRVLLSLDHPTTTLAWEGLP